MKVSVIVTSYDIDRYGDLYDTIESVLEQDYRNFELVLVLEDKQLVESVNDDWSDDKINIEYSEENLGLSRARNLGASISEGELIVFTDDDIIADKKWLTELVKTYDEKDDAFGAGGRCEPIWPEDKKPKYIPPEFYWLFGVTHRHHPEKGVVRNTFGCNIAFNRDLFLEYDGFNNDLGKKHGTNIQGEETEMSYRISDSTGLSMYYNPDALIQHKVYSSQTNFKYVVDRCFWQGYTKRIMEDIKSDSISQEHSYLRRILIDSNIQNIKNLLKFDKPFISLLHIFMIIFLTSAVGAGYLYGKIVY